MVPLSPVTLSLQQTVSSRLRYYGVVQAHVCRIPHLLCHFFSMKYNPNKSKWYFDAPGSYNYVVYVKYVFILPSRLQSAFISKPDTAGNFVWAWESLSVIPVEKIPAGVTFSTHPFDDTSRPNPVKSITWHTPASYRLSPANNSGLKDSDAYT